ncbi:hypothetical protein HZS_3089, partial [Henneguya salminicola]
KPPVQSGDIQKKFHQMLILITDEYLSVFPRTACFTSHHAQFLIVMIHDYRTNEYVPYIFSLLTGKDEQIYFDLLIQFVVLLKYSLMSIYITVYFKTAFINVAKH